jgi:hypothetical protein
VVAADRHLPADPAARDVRPRRHLHRRAARQPGAETDDQWSTTGVPGITYAISFSGPEGATQQQFVTGRMPSDCTESGAFGVLLPPGKYVARMIVVGGSDAPPDPTHAFEVSQP